MEKLTYEEVMKCLEHRMPEDKVCVAAYDLINRQKAEIERLQKENKEQKLILEAINDEMNPLPFETDFDKAMRKAKSEAYKEFAERLCKDRVSNDPVVIALKVELEELTESK